MARRRAGDLEVGLSLDARRFADGLKRASSGIDDFAVKLRGGVGGLLGLQAALSVAKDVARFASAIDRAVRSTAKLGADLNQIARSYGVAAGQLDLMRRSLGEFGVEANRVDKAMFDMQQRLGEFLARGTGEARFAFLELYGSAAQLRQEFERLGPGGLFEDVLRRLSRIDDNALRLSTGMKIFSEAYQQLDRAVATGNASLDAAIERQRALGYITDEQAAELERVSQSYTDLAAATRLALVQVVAEAGPVIRQLTRLATESAKLIVVAWRQTLITLSASGVPGLSGLASEWLKQIGRAERLASIRASIAAERIRQAGAIAPTAGEAPAPDLSEVVFEVDRATRGYATQLEVVHGLAHAREREAHATERTKAVVQAILDLDQKRLRLQDVAIREPVSGAYGGMTQEERRAAAREALDEMDAQAERTRRAWEGVGATATRALADMVLGAKTARDALAELASVLVSALGSGLASALSGGTFGEGLAGFFGGGRAAGGPVVGGRPYLVGESGPELVVPRMSGAVVPNAGLGGGTVNVSISGHSLTETDVLNILSRAGPMIRRLARG